MKFTGIAFFLLAAATMPFAQLLPQKAEADTPKLDRAMVFKVDYGAEAATDSSRSIDQPVRSAQKNDLTNNALFINALCATGAALSAFFDGNGAADCFVIPAKQLRF